MAFVNAFNPLKNWYDSDVIGIDTGIILADGGESANRICLGHLYEDSRKRSAEWSEPGSINTKPQPSQSGPYRGMLLAHQPQGPFFSSKRRLGVHRLCLPELIRPDLRAGRTWTGPGSVVSRAGRALFGQESPCWLQS